MITVELVSGRTFVGRVDLRTSDESLWLRYGTATMTVIRPIAWDRILRAFRGREPIDPVDFKQLAATLKSAPDQNRPYAESTDSSSSDRTKQDLETRCPATAETTRATRSAAPQVRSVDFDVYLANWDADVEADGLILHVYPLAENGKSIGVNATLNVALTILRTRPSSVPKGRGAATEQIAYWTRQLRNDDLGDQGAVLRLPFQTVHPEFDTGTTVHGLVHVRLTVPGHGVFESTQDTVRVRPFAPLRDALERAGGRRFLSHEQTGSY